MNIQEDYYSNMTPQELKIQYKQTQNVFIKKLILDVYNKKKLEFKSKLNTDPLDILINNNDDKFENFNSVENKLDKFKTDIINDHINNKLNDRFSSEIQSKIFNKTVAPTNNNSNTIGLRKQFN